MRRVRLTACSCMLIVPGAQVTPSPQTSIDGFPVVWLAIGGGLAVAALIFYFLHIRRL